MVSGRLHAVACLVAWGVGACASGPPIRAFPGHPDVHVIERQSLPRPPGAPTLTEATEAEARAFCAPRGGGYAVVDAQLVPMWGVAGNQQRLTLRFRCG